MYKLRIYGLNAIFGLQLEISVGGGLITAVATGTAVFLRALPVPPVFKVMRNLEILDEEDQKLTQTQHELVSLSENNQKNILNALSSRGERRSSIEDSEDSGSDVSSLFSEKGERDEVADSVGVRPTQKPQTVVQIDDEADEDLILFLDTISRNGLHLCNTEILPSEDLAQIKNFQIAKLITQKQILATHHPNRQLAAIFKSLYQDISFQYDYYDPCIVTNVKIKMDLVKDNLVQICVTAFVTGEIANKASFFIEYLSPRASFLEPAPLVSSVTELEMNPAEDDVASQESSDQDYLVNGLAEEEVEPIEMTPIVSEQATFDRPIKQGSRDATIDRQIRTSSRDASYGFSELPSREAYAVEITPTSFLYNSEITEHYGRISLHFIKESNLVYSSIGSLGLFSTMFMQEVLAIVKAHTVALGGNALLGYSVDQCFVTESMNQGYALISVSGDVVKAKAI
jgi:hypothetical protein